MSRHETEQVTLCTDSKRSLAPGACTKAKSYTKALSLAKDKQETTYRIGRRGRQLEQWLRRFRRRERLVLRHSRMLCNAWIIGLFKLALSTDQSVSVRPRSRKEEGECEVAERGREGTIPPRQDALYVSLGFPTHCIRVEYSLLPLLLSHSPTTRQGMISRDGTCLYTLLLFVT
jgi:hypothetical protein